MVQRYWYGGPFIRRAAQTATHLAVKKEHHGTESSDKKAKSSHLLEYVLVGARRRLH